MRQFLADASHELRTPLTSIRGYAELARMQRRGRRRRHRATTWRRIESEGTRMSRLVEDLLMLARGDQGARAAARAGRRRRAASTRPSSGARAAFPERHDRRSAGRPACRWSATPTSCSASSATWSPTPPCTPPPAGRSGSRASAPTATAWSIQVDRRRPGPAAGGGRARVRTVLARRQGPHAGPAAAAGWACRSSPRSSQAHGGTVRFDSSCEAGSTVTGVRLPVVQPADRPAAAAARSDRDPSRSRRPGTIEAMPDSAVASAPSELDPPIAARLKRDAAGLVAAVVQQHDTGEVLMVGWMDDEALHRTLTTGRATYWSRSRQEYWVKGETSGHVQHVKSVALDCDGDAVLVRVDQVGAACHTGDRTCFDAGRSGLGMTHRVIAPRRPRPRWPATHRLGRRSPARCSPTPRRRSGVYRKLAARPARHVPARVGRAGRVVLALVVRRRERASPRLSVATARRSWTGDVPAGVPTDGDPLAGARRGRGGRCKGPRLPGPAAAHRRLRRLPRLRRGAPHRAAARTRRSTSSACPS